MAKKREPVKPVEPASESDEASSEEVEASESESEQTAAQTKSKPQQATPPPQQQPASSSEEEEEEEEEESGSESESESDVPESNVVKPLTLSNVSKKTASKTKVPDPEPPIPTKASSSAKRPAQEDSATPTKDAKKKKTAEPEPEIAEKKSNIFQRLWTEDDEIAILGGMIDYTSKKKSDPMADLNSFHDFIKKDLHADFTKTQLQNKIKRLKKKFGNNNGKKRVLLKPHEQVLYNLSNKIWANELGKKTAGTEMNAAGPVKVVKNTWFGAEKVNLGSGIGSGEEHMLATGRWLFESGRGIEGESEWNDLRMEDLKLFQRRLEVRLRQTELVMDVMNRGDQ